MIFQEPMTSLDPLYTIGNQLIEPIMHHQKIGVAEAKARAIDMMKLVKIQEPNGAWALTPMKCPVASASV